MHGPPLSMASWLVMAAALAGCRAFGPLDAGCDGALFGQPVAATGLDGTQCRGQCSCSGVVDRQFTEEELAQLGDWTLTRPFAELQADPYLSPPPESAPRVCAVVVEDVASRRYHLESYDSVAAAAEAGALLTHHDACGLCSPLQDLQVYARDRDLGAAVKRCGLDHFGGTVEALTGCLQGLGFTRPCAQVWAFNVRNTQSRCLGPCLAAGSYHQPDGTLGECLACDERESGPTFKAVAGRTRRNTGLASSICRPCAEVRGVPHAYPRPR